MQPFCNFTNRNIRRCQAIRKSLPVGQCAKAARYDSKFCDQHQPDKIVEFQPQNLVQARLLIGGQRILSNERARDIADWATDVLDHLKREYRNTGGAHTLELIMRMEPDYKPPPPQQ